MIGVAIIASEGTGSGKSCPVTGAENIALYEQMQRRLELRRQAREAGLVVHVPAGRGVYDRRRDPLMQGRG